MTVYLDHNATTPLDDAVLEAMLPYLKENFGNPSGVYRMGRDARSAVDQARQQVAALVNAHPSQVIFTSGGTEANNLALRGCVEGMGVRHLAISAVEHPSVRDIALAMQQRGLTLTEVAVDSNGVVGVAQLRDVLAQAPQWLSVMMANNETGAINDIAALGAVCAEHDIILHTDAVQAAGKIVVDFQALGVQLLSLSSHKMYGPKGAGALIVDKRLSLTPLLKGGGQEKGRRSGTENVAAIVGFGKAAELAKLRLHSAGEYLLQLSQHLEAGLGSVEGLTVFAQTARRLPNTCFFSVAGIDGETLLMNLDLAGFAVASGSACSSKSEDPSHVLMAMGVEKDLARGAIRVSLGIENTREEVDAFLQTLKQQVKALRSMSVMSV